MVDLNKEMKRVNDDYFHLFELPEIKFMRNDNRKKRKQIYWALYIDDRKTIMIHSIFKKPFISKRFLHYIIFHELLHYIDDRVFKRPYENGIYHDLFFREREKKFRGFNYVKKYEDKLFSTLC